MSADLGRMAVQGNDLEQWQIEEQNPDESWATYAQSTTRTPKKLLIILAVILALGGITFVVGRFLAGQSSEEAALNTTSTDTTVGVIDDVNTLLNEMARQLDESGTEPYLAVQIYNSDIGVLGRVATTEERDQIVALLEETFTSELDPDAIAVEASLDSVSWLEEIAPAVEAFSVEPILSNGFGINNAQIILDSELPQTVSQENLIEAFGALNVELVDNSLVSVRDQTAQVVVRLEGGAVQISGTVPSEGVARQVQESAESVYDTGIETSLEISEAAFASLQFGQVGSTISLAGVFESHELTIDDQITTIVVPTNQAFNDTNQVNQRLETFLVLLEQQIGQNEQLELEIFTPVESEDSSDAQADNLSAAVNSLLPEQGATISETQIVEEADGDPRLVITLSEES